MTYVNLEDAVKAVGGVPMRLENGAIRHPLSAIADAVFALRALPTLSVTDDDIAARLKELGYTRLEFQLDSTGGHEATYYTAEGCERIGLGPPPVPSKVTTEMVEVAREQLKVFVGMSVLFPSDGAIRTALEAALGPLPVPPSE